MNNNMNIFRRFFSRGWCSVGNGGRGRCADFQEIRVKGQGPCARGLDFFGEQGRS